MDKQHIVATYTIAKEDPPHDTVWTDIREAKPRCRVRATGQDPVTVKVDRDGKIDVTGGARDVDQYEDEKYKEIRDEVR